MKVLSVPVDEVEHFVEECFDNMIIAFGVHGDEKLISIKDVIRYLEINKLEAQNRMAISRAQGSPKH